MNIIDNSDGVAGLPPTARAYRAPTKQPAHDRNIRRADISEFSGTGFDLAGRDELTDVRAGLIDRVRGEIANGTYQSRRKIDVIIERLVAELNQIDLLV